MFEGNMDYNEASQSVLDFDMSTKFQLQAAVGVHNALPENPWE